MRTADQRNLWLSVLLVGAMSLAVAAISPPLTVAADVADATANLIGVCASFEAQHANRARVGRRQTQHQPD